MKTSTRKSWNSGDLSKNTKILDYFKRKPSGTCASVSSNAPSSSQTSQESVHEDKKADHVSLGVRAKRGADFNASQAPVAQNGRQSALVASKAITSSKSRLNRIPKHIPTEHPQFRPFTFSSPLHNRSAVAESPAQPISRLDTKLELGSPPRMVLRDLPPRVGRRRVAGKQNLSTSATPSSSSSPADQHSSSHASSSTACEDLSPIVLKNEPSLQRLPSVSSRLRNGKKRLPHYKDQDVISLSSESVVHTHITISSTPTIITVSSTDISQEVSASTRPARRGKAVDKLFPVEPSMAPVRRRSPRLIEKENDRFPSSAPSPKRKAAKKRKSADSDDEIDFIQRAPNIVPSQRPILPSPSSSKKAKHNHPSPIKVKDKELYPAPEDIEVIPSSQSDEQEYMPLRNRGVKTVQEIAECVDQWRKQSSQCAVNVITIDKPVLPSHDTLDDPMEDHHISADFSGQDLAMDFEMEAPDFTLAGTPPRFASKSPSSHASFVTAPLAGPDISDLLAEAPANPHTPILSRHTLETSCPPSSSKRSFRSVDHPEDDLLSSPTRHSLAHSPLSSLSTLTSSPSSAHRACNPQTPKSPHVVMPVDEQSKTAAIIAQIKAQALARAAMTTDSDDEEKTFGELKELSDSSDLEDEDNTFANMLKKTASKKQSNGCLQADSASVSSREDKPKRTRTRQRTQSRTPSPSPSPSSSRNAAIGMGRSLRSRHPKPPVASSSKQSMQPAGKRKSLPFAHLIKEKAKTGDHQEASILLASFRDDTMNVDTESPSASLRRVESSFASTQTDDADLDATSIGEEDRRRLLGDQDGAAVGKIIAKDKTGFKKQVEQIVGLQFWDDASVSQMEVDECEFVLPQLKIQSDHPVLRAIKDCVDSNDARMLELLIGSGALLTPGVEWSAQIVEWLAFLATNTVDKSLGTAALRGLSAAAEKDLGVELRFSYILSALVRLGAKEDIADTLQWSSKASVIVHPPARNDVLDRLVVLCSTFARARKCHRDDVPSLVSALLCVALDRSTALELRLLVMRTVEELIISVCSDEEMSRSPMEVEICKQVVRLGMFLSVPSRVYLLSLISGGAYVAGRIAQWIGYGLLAEKVDVVNDLSTPLPPLSHLIVLLAQSTNIVAMLPDCDTFAPFEIKRSQGQESDTDFDLLSQRVEMLDCVLTNIPTYVRIEQEEHRAVQEKIEEERGVMLSPSKRAGRTAQKTKLEFLIDQLNILSNKIVESRTGQMERSRIKTHISQLAKRIFYQRDSVLKSTQSKTVNLESYFKRTAK